MRQSRRPASINLGRFLPSWPLSWERTPCRGVKCGSIASLCSVRNVKGLQDEATLGVYQRARAAGPGALAFTPCRQRFAHTAQRDRRNINCDEKLQAVFGTATTNGFKMNKPLQKCAFSDFD